MQCLVVDAGALVIMMMISFLRTLHDCVWRDMPRTTPKPDKRVLLRRRRCSLSLTASHCADSAWSTAGLCSHLWSRPGHSGRCSVSCQFCNRASVRELCGISQAVTRCCHHVRLFLLRCCYLSATVAHVAACCCREHFAGSWMESVILVYVIFVAFY